MCNEVSRENCYVFVLLITSVILAAIDLYMQEVNNSSLLVAKSQRKYMENMFSFTLFL
jgi:hypothetical protein